MEQIPGCLFEIRERIDVAGVPSALVNELGKRPVLAKFRIRAHSFLKCVKTGGGLTRFPPGGQVLRDLVGTPLDLLLVAPALLQLLAMSLPEALLSFVVELLSLSGLCGLHRAYDHVVQDVLQSPPLSVGPAMPHPQGFGPVQEKH